MDKNSVQAIQEYIDEHYSKFPVMWNKDLFRQWSYSKWISNEILDLVKKEKQYPAKMVIETFIDKLDDWACKNDSTSRLFSAAYDAAVDIMDLFL